MIAGEWAVLDGNRCIVAAVNKRVHSIVEPLAGGYISVSIDDYKLQDIRFTWDGTNINLFKIYQVDAEKLKFTKESIEVALRFLKENSLVPEVPEDITALIKNSIILKKHLEKNKKDMNAVRGLNLTESKIKRLVKYYKRTERLAENWKFSPQDVKMYV